MMENIDKKAHFMKEWSKYVPAMDQQDTNRNFKDGTVNLISIPTVHI